MRVGKKRLRDGTIVTVEKVTDEQGYCVYGTDETGRTFTWSIDGKYNTNLPEHGYDIVADLCAGQKERVSKSTEWKLYETMLVSPEYWRQLLNRVIPETPREAYDRHLRGNEF